MAETPEQKPKHIMPIGTEGFGLQVHKFQFFNAIVPAYVEKEDLLRHELWSHVASKLLVNDEIRVVRTDGAYRAHLIVVAKIGGGIRVAMLSFQSLTEAVTEAQTAELNANDLFDVAERGVLKWCVIDKATGGVVEKDIPTKKEATAKAIEHFKKISGK
jgi:hypothetical protein